MARVTLLAQPPPVPHAQYAHKGIKTIGRTPIHPNPRPTTSLKTPAHQHNYVGPSPGGQLGGKTYVPRPPRLKRAKRIIYTAPPLKGFVPAKRGAKAQHEIKHFQNTVGPVLPLMPFERLVREILQDITESVDAGTFRITPNAIQALRVAAEAHVTHVMRVSSLLTFHAKRVTLHARDMKLCRRLMEEYGLNI